MTKKRTPKRKVKKAKEVEFSDGVHHSIEGAEEARNLEDILGFKETNPFGVSSAEELETALEELQLTNLQEMAVNAGVFPSGTKATLKNKLRKAFNQYTHGGSRKVVQVTKPMVDPESEQGKKLLKLMSEGF
jgi:hypothetical protein